MRFAARVFVLIAFGAAVCFGAVAAVLWIYAPESA